MYLSIIRASNLKLGAKIISRVPRQRKLWSIAPSPYPDVVSIPTISQRGRKIVSNWLFATAGGVAVMVTVGGITRLTRSGLSMTDWKLQGSLPPMNESEWQAEFDRYKKYPEYQQRKSMTLEEFQYIYFWEYIHRMLGRTLGILYGVPLLFFSLRGMIPSHVRGKCLVLLGLGSAQGLVGWWMVKSGLSKEHMTTLKNGEHTQIRVSAYRLAAHLGMAFATFSLLVHTALDVLNDPKAVQKTLTSFNQKYLPLAIKLRAASLVSAKLAFLTAISGALVAGNDAGHAYNMFPKMTYEHWIPPEILEMEPLWRNFFENSATVQATHRTLAFLTLGTVAGTFFLAKRGRIRDVALFSSFWNSLPAEAKKAQLVTLAAASGQVTLGITTLLLHVPVSLATAHQAGAVVLLGSSIWSAHTLRFVRSVASNAPPK